jgi:hypothetical protein
VNVVKVDPESKIVGKLINLIEALGAVSNNMIEESTEECIYVTSNEYFTSGIGPIVVLYLDTANIVQYKISSLIRPVTSTLTDPTLSDIIIPELFNMVLFAVLHSTKMLLLFAIFDRPDIVNEFLPGEN